MSLDQDQRLARRKFFRSGLLLGSGVVFSVVAPSSSAELASKASEALPPGQGYQLTPHVETYYRTLRGHSTPHN